MQLVNINDCINRPVKSVFLTAICLSGWFMPALSQHYLMHPSIPADTSYNLKSEFHKQRVRFPFIQMAVPSDSGSYRVFRNLVYARLDDRDLHIDVFLPVHSASAIPAILMVHGGGWRSGNKDMDHYMASQLAENGFAALCVEYRLSMEALYPAAVQDITTAIRWTRAIASTTFPINPQKIALKGSSAGGQLVSLIGSLNGPYRPFKQIDCQLFPTRCKPSLMWMAFWPLSIQSPAKGPTNPEPPQLLPSGWVLPLQLIEIAGKKPLPYPM
jgi:hypothetical protein